MIRLTRRQFVALVRRCYADLPARVHQSLDNLDVVVEEWPSAEIVGSSEAGSRDELLGLFSGVSREERGGDLPLLPDKITIFQRPIEAMCDSKEEVAQEVRKTLLHEIGHYLGMEEGELERLGYG